MNDPWWKRLRLWLKQVFCLHEIVMGVGIVYCRKCDYWEH